ncbi:MAG TPA: hypothetical protein VK492_01675 [Chitinophagaceae bacterium]|nr:hypothetical protein [Chitinophagaceae bacterium]
MITPSSPLVTAGRVMFALGLIGLAILGFMTNDLIVGRPPAWPTSFSAKETFSLVLNVLLVAGCVAIIFQRQGAFAAFLTAAIIFTFSFLIRYIPAIVKAQPKEILWNINAYKTLALIGGSLIIGVYFLRNNSPGSGKIFLVIGSIFLSMFFIISGLAHFKFADFIIDGLMPSYIPFHPFWTYFCGIALIAGGIGIQINPLRKIAALLVGIMITGWFLLLHIPRFFANTNDPSDQMGLCESFAFAGIMFVLYGLFKAKKEN